MTTPHLLDLGVSDVSHPGTMAARPARAVRTRKTKKTPPGAKAKKEPRQRKGLSMKVNTKTGAIHVRHLSDIPVGGQLVRFGAVGDLAVAEGKVPKRAWNHVAKSGAFAGHAAGPFELNDKVFGEIVRNFHATVNKRIPIDFEHASESDPTSGSIPHTGVPAQGWIVDLKQKGTDLWGLFEWLEPARTYVEEGRYKFLSPAIRFGARDRVSGKPIGARLSSCALTNVPFLDGLSPVVCRDFDHADKGREAAVEITGDPDADPEELALSLSERIRTLSERLALLRGDDGPGDEQDTPDGDEQDDADGEDDEDAADLSAALRDTTPDGDDAKEGTPMDTNRDSAIVALTEAQAKTAELTTKLSDAHVRAASLEGELVALRAREKERDAREVEARVAEAYETYKDQKKLSDIDKKVMLSTCASDRALFEQQYPHVPTRERHLLSDLTSKERDAAPVIPAHAGGSSENVVRMSQAHIAQRLSVEKGIPLEQAQLIVARAQARRLRPRPRPRAPFSLDFQKDLATMALNQQLASTYANGDMPGMNFGVTDIPQHTVVALDIANTVGTGQQGHGILIPTVAGQRILGVALDRIPAGTSGRYRTLGTAVCTADGPLTPGVQVMNSIAAGKLGYVTAWTPGAGVMPLGMTLSAAVDGDDVLIDLLISPA